MSKVFVLLLVAGIAVVLLADVVEISFHADRLSGIPAVLGNLTKDGSVIAKGKLLLVRANRSVVRLVIQDKEKRLENAVLNVSEDADRLSQTLKKGVADAGTLFPQAELLLSSIKEVRATAEDAPVEAVAALKEKSAASFEKARQALGQLQELREEYAAIEEEFNLLTKSLEEQIGSLDLGSEPSTAADTEADANTELRF